MPLKPNLEIVLKLQNNPIPNCKPRVLQGLQGLAKSMPKVNTPISTSNKFGELDNEEAMELEGDTSYSDSLVFRIQR